MKLVGLGLLVSVLIIPVQELIVGLVLLQEGIVDSLLLVEVSILLILEVHLIVLVLQLPEMLQVDASLVQDFLAFRVYEDHLLVFFELLPRLEVLVAVFLAEFYRFDLGFRLLYQGKHALSLLLGRSHLKLLVQ